MRSLNSLVWRNLTAHPLRSILTTLAITLGVAALRGRRRATFIALARVGLACTFLLAPVGNVALPLPSSSNSTPRPSTVRLHQAKKPVI